MRTTARSIFRVALAALGLRSARPFCAMASGFHSPSRHQDPSRALTPDLPLAATRIRLRRSLSPTKPRWRAGEKDEWQSKIGDITEGAGCTKKRTQVR